MKSQIFESAARFAVGAGRSALNAVTPPLCPITQDPTQGPAQLSPAAWAALHFIERPFCARCGLPFSTDYGAGFECAKCIAEPPVFDCARAAFVHQDAARKLVSRFKYSDRTELGGLLARAMARAGKDLISKDAVIAPIPLHWRRRVARRFNQSALLAEEISKLTGAALELRLCVRKRATPPQVEMDSESERRRNVAGAFAVSGAYRGKVKGAKIVLVDDVLTTGATLSAAARALKAAGAARVDALVLTRVVRGAGGAI